MSGRIYGLETEFGVLPVLETKEDIAEKVRRRGFLRNGGRFYVCVSGNHPEYATPECASVRELVRYDKAGEVIAQALAPKLELYKNNLDYRGEETFGCHENYLVQEYIFNKEKLSMLIPFLVTRQIFAGAGWLEYYYDGEMKYNLSQRAQKITEEFSTVLSAAVDRAIIHMKGEDHTSVGKRLHLILGDTNMSEVSTYLKVGTTSLVLDLLEDDKLGGMICLENPLLTLRNISEDQTRRWIGRTNDGRTISGVDIQREYLERAQAYRGVDSETDDILRRWEKVLNLLEGQNFPALSRQIDWAAKKNLIDLCVNDERGVTVDKLRSIDLIYSAVNKDESLYYALQEQDRIERIVSGKGIKDAVMTPPGDTRAWCRGNLIGIDIIKSINWESIDTKYGEIDINDPFNDYAEELEKILSMHEAEQTNTFKKDSEQKLK